MFIWMLLWRGWIRFQRVYVQYLCLSVALGLWMGFLMEVPPERVMPGTPHPHDGTEGIRPWVNLVPNIYGGRRDDHWDRYDKRVEFAEYLSKHTQFNVLFNSAALSLLQTERDFVGDAFFGELRQLLESVSPVRRREFRGIAIHMTNHQIKLVRKLTRQCLENPTVGCDPYVRSHEHETYAYVGAFKEYYKVINFIFPIPLSGGDVRLIVMDIMYTDRTLGFKGNGAASYNYTMLNDESEHFLDLMMNLVGYEMVHLDTAWWPEENYIHYDPDHDLDVFGWVWDEQEYDPKSKLPRTLQILRSLLHMAAYQNLGFRFAEVVGFRNGTLNDWDGSPDIVLYRRMATIVPIEVSHT